MLRFALIACVVLSGCAAAPRYEPGAGSHSGQDFRLAVTVCKFAYCARSREEAAQIHQSVVAQKSKP